MRISASRDTFRNMKSEEFKPSFRTDVGVVWAGDPATANGVPTFTPVNPFKLTLG